MNHVLVTGGAGYIGSHACKALARAGYVPVVYDNLKRGHEWAVKWGPFELGDLLDPLRLDNVFQTYRFAAVMHFASYTYVGESMNDPAKYYRNNVVGSRNLLKAICAYDVDKMIFSSSSAVYGVPDHIPVKEDAPITPINPYGETKAMVEQMLRDLDDAYGVRSISLRYFNAAGADPEGEIGEAHQPETHLIPLAIRGVFDRLYTLAIMGKDYDTPDGTAIRDYVHVVDLIEAHMLALDYLLSGGQSTVYNIGAGQGYSVQEVVDAVSLVAGRRVKVKDSHQRAGDPPVLVSNTDKASKYLGWSPKRSELTTIIADALNWHFQANLV